MTDLSPLGPADPLDRLAQALAAAVTSLQAAPPDVPRDRLVGRVRGALSQLRTVAGPQAGREGALSEADAAWLHALREPVTAIVGWARLLDPTSGVAGAPARQVRAVKAIERNVKRLLEILGRPRAE